MPASDTFTSVYQHMLLWAFLGVCLPATGRAAADPAAPSVPQVNGADAALTDFVAGDLGVDRLPFFHLYRCGVLRAGFAANLSKLAQLRAEIAFLKACSEPACSI